MKRKIRTAGKWAGLALLAALICYLGLFDGWKDVVAGRGLRMEREMFRLPSGKLTEARIYLLEGAEDVKPGGRFRLGWMGDAHDTFGEVVIKDPAQLRAIQQAWEEQGDRGYISMCHGPVYGVRLYENGRMVREAAFCWGCSNYSYSSWPGVTLVAPFGGRSEEGLAFFELIASKLPYPGEHPKPLGHYPFVLREPSLWYKATRDGSDSALGWDQRNLLSLTQHLFAYQTWNKAAPEHRAFLYEMIAYRIRISSNPECKASEVLFPEGISEELFSDPPENRRSFFTLLRDDVKLDYRKFTKALEEFDDAVENRRKAEAPMEE